MNPLLNPCVLVIDRREPVVRQVLDRVPALDVRPFSSIEDALRSSVMENAHAVLVDLTAADTPFDFQGLDRLRLAFPSLAVILLADSTDEDRALAALRRGAHEYLVRDALTAENIARAIRNARKIADLEYRLAALDTQLDQANRRLRDILLDMARHRQPSLERSARMVRALDVPPAPVEDRESTARGAEPMRGRHPDAARSGTAS
ncbi:MAG: response regulator transcription factor [Planctomycetes bacterium]|nr:response regulator transcription factor [Planctomycetota bacterium]